MPAVFQLKLHFNLQPATGLQNIPATLDFCIFNLCRPPGGLFIFFDRFVQICFNGVLFSCYKTIEKRNKWALIFHSWNKIDVEIIGWFFMSSWFTTFKKLFDSVFNFLLSDWFLMSSALLFFVVFSMSAQIVEVVIDFILSSEVNN